MTLFDQIKANLEADRREKNRSSISIHTVILGECERIGKNLSDESVIAVLKKLLKDTKESLKFFKSPSSIEAAEFEIGVLESYLPQQLTEEEIKLHVGVLMAGDTATDMKGIMAWFKQNHPGKYDGKIVSKYAKGFITSEVLIFLTIIGMLVFAVAMSATKKERLNSERPVEVETRCVLGYEHTISLKGYASQIVNENGRGIPCGENVSKKVAQSSEIENWGK
jgi:uncharacterized protein YqeY